jgi:hypothetical protein
LEHCSYQRLTPKKMEHYNLFNDLAKLTRYSSRTIDAYFVTLRYSENNTLRFADSDTARHAASKTGISRLLDIKKPPDPKAEG